MKFGVQVFKRVPQPYGVLEVELTQEDLEEAKRRRMDLTEYARRKAILILAERLETNGLSVLEGGYVIGDAYPVQ